MASRRCVRALVLYCVASVATARGEDPQAIPAAELAEWLEGPDAPLVLDVRGGAAYRKGTIAAALDAGKDPAGFLPDSRGGHVVLILSADMSVEPWRARLGDYGYRVQMLAGGMPAWRAAGLPEERPVVSYRSPGTVPFVIPKGLCELNEPAHTFD